MTTLLLFAVVAAIVALAMIAMAVGVLFRRPCLRGSCGGPEVLAPDGTRLSCSGCPRRDGAPVKLSKTA